MREVCVVILKKSHGGTGQVVEIQEAKFGKRKYNKGRITQGIWIFGDIARGTNKCVVLAHVATREHSELLPIIRTHIIPGTTVISDCWKTCNCLGFVGYSHLTGNLTYDLVDPDTGARTQHIEWL